MVKLSIVLTFIFSGALMAFAGNVGAQQPYPNKPIRIIVSLSPGGSVDGVARLVGQKLGESWGQPVIVDNRPGGSGVIGGTALVKSPPDGYTLLLSASSHVVTPLLVTIPYDAIKDFAPVATVTKNESILVVHPSVPANNLQEFIALTKSLPGQLNYATPLTGGVSHLAIETLIILAGIKMQHIPYKGGGQILADLIGGQVEVYFSPPPSVLPHITSGRLKAIAISGETRMAALPQLPTFTEAGLPGLDVKYWNGILAPAGTPKGIIDKLSNEIAKILSMPDIKEKLVSQGMEAFYSTPDQFAALLKADMAKYAKVIKAANIKLGN